MARALLGAPTTTTTVINFIIVFIFSTGLRFAQLFFDFEFKRGTERVFENFLLMDKSVTCFKLFISSYRQVHADGGGLLGFSSLVGLFLHLFTIVIHLHTNYRSRARAWISGMAIFLAAGACMLAAKIPEDYCAWHGTAVEATLDFLICIEAVLLVLSKMSEQGGNDKLLRDLILTSVETLINYWLFADYLANTHSPWAAHNILHLVGSSMAVVIGVGQIAWLAYKAYTHGVFAWEAETAAGTAADGGYVEQLMVEEGAQVQERSGKSSVFTGEVEMAAGAGDGGRGGESCSVSLLL